MRLEISTPGGRLTGFALSPDGRSLVYPATVDRRTQLWLRPLDLETAQALPGTEGALTPFWSPDSRSIGFFAGGQLKRIDLANGLVQTLASVPSGAVGGAWGDGGVILFAPSTMSALYRVAAGGGATTEATHLNPPLQTGHRVPNFLPDGRHFLFYAVGSPDTKGVYMGSIDSTDTWRLLDADSKAVFSPPDWVLFARQGALMAQRLDMEALKPLGAPQAVAVHVAMDDNSIAFTALSASAAGPIAFRASPGVLQLVWFDRSGRSIGTIGEPDAGQPRNPWLSPDGRTAAYERTVSGNTDVWLLDMARGMLRRFTTDVAKDRTPTWSPDGRRIVFSSFRRGVQDLYMKAVTGDATEALLLASPEQKYVDDWSSDGKWVLYTSQSSKTGSDLWVVPISGDQKPLPVAQTPSSEFAGQFSPDGRFIAYQSDESGRSEIYVQPFPGPGGKSQVSTTGGGNPLWRRDGRELFYQATGRLIAVPITLNGPNVEAGTPVALFSVPVGASLLDNAPDGQRFLALTVVKEAPPITILLNWKPGSREAR